MDSNATYQTGLHALAIAIAADVPVILWSAPGLGKSSVLRAMADGQGAHMETVIASVHDQTDFNGLPIPHDDGTVRLAPPRWARNIVDAGGGYVFLDEISNAAPSVQAALLRVVLERVIGDLTFPAGTRFVAAANPPESAADGYDLTAPMANRFCHLEWSVPSDVVAQGLMYGWPDVPTLVVNTEQYERALTDYRMKVGTFLLKVKPNLAHAMPTNSEASGRAWPSSRTWDFAIRMLATVDAVKLSASLKKSVRLTLLSGTLGHGAALEFANWERKLDLPDPEQLIQDPRTWTVPKSVDAIYAVSGALVAALDRENSAQRWISVGDALARIAEEGYPDIAYTAARRWKDKRPVGGRRPNPSPYCVTQLAELLAVVPSKAGSKGAA